MADIEIGTFLNIKTSAFLIAGFLNFAHRLLLQKKHTFCPDDSVFCP
jgi:hypothetical protein